MIFYKVCMAPMKVAWMTLFSDYLTEKMPDEPFWTAIILFSLDMLVVAYSIIRKKKLFLYEIDISS